MTGVALGAHAALAQSSGGAGGSFGSGLGGAGGSGFGVAGAPGGLVTDAGGGGGAGADGGDSGGGLSGGGAGSNGPTPTNGDDGTNGDGGVSNGKGGGGGGGGGSAFVNVFGVTLSGGTVTAGSGGNGGIGWNAGGGGGGSGGYGLYNSSVTQDTVAGGAALRGGDGGAGGSVNNNFPGTTVRGGNAGDGGGGAQYLAAGSSITITSGTIAGGNGGPGGGPDVAISAVSTLVGGTGGAGGVGILGAGLTISNAGTITGGNGGNGGGSYNTNGGDGGTGGAAISGTNLTITNTGTITGGNGGGGGQPHLSGGYGFAGAGGVGIRGANMAITIGAIGSVRGGWSGDGVTRANAIEFTGGSNSLTLESGAVVGNVVFGVGTHDNTFTLLGVAGGGDVLGNGGTDKMQLGGTRPGTGLGVLAIGSAFLNFTSFEKIGSGTWTLSGTPTQLLTPWTITQGTLSVASDATLGNAASALTFNGGILQVTGTTFASTTRTINWGAGGGGFDIASAANTFTINQSLSGSGGLAKLGAGTLTLAAVNSYTGATAVDAGTLRAGVANAFASGSAHTIAAGATLDLNGFNQAIGSLAGAGTVTLGGAALIAGGDNSARTFSGAITGTGAFTKTGTGNLTLSGTNTYAGPTTVDGGTLSVNGSLAGSVTVNSGGVLGGNGAVGGVTVNAAGTLAPGNSIGLLTINGNLVLGPGAIYRVEVSASDADRTNVTGTAQLGGTLQLAFQPGPYTARNYTILSAAGGRSGTFDSVTIENQPAALRAEVTYTTTDVMLVTLTSQIMGVAGLTPNQRAVAAGQDAAFNGGRPMINALFGLTAAQLPVALDQLSGGLHGSTVSTLANDSLAMRGAILGRLRQASFGGGEMASMAALSLGGPQTAFADGAMESALAYAKSPATSSPIVTKAPMAAPRPTSDTVFWAQGFGAWGKFDGGGNATSVKRDLAGFITGVDTRVASNGRLGIAAGYTGTKASSLGTANVDTAHIAGYGGWRFGSFNARAGGAYAFHAIDTDRIVNFPGFADRLTARYDGSTGQVFGELGHGFALGNIAFEPFAGAAWVRVSTDGAAERGGVAALNVAAQTFETGYSTLGIRAASIVPLANDMILIPRATVAWQHAFSDVTPNAVMAFQAAPTAFTVSGAPIARNSLLTEAGLDLAISRAITVGLSYVGQVGTAVTDHAAKGKFSWVF